MIDGERGASSVKRVHVAPAKEYLGYRMPEELQGLLGEPPLYIALAYWGLARGCAFSRDDVAMAFAICPRRAADAMTYLMRRELAFARPRVLYVGRGRTRSRLLVVERWGMDKHEGTAEPSKVIVSAEVETSERRLHAQRQWFLRSANLALPCQAAPDGGGDG